MWRVIAGLIILHIMLTFIDGIVVGSSDIYVTKLTSNLTEEATTVNVQDTGGWRTSDYLWIGDEKIRYNGRTPTSFTNCVRGYEGTDARAHALGQRVYSRSSDAVRTSAGFNVMDIGASAGAINIALLPIRFLWTALPQLIVWNYSFLKEGSVQYIRLILVGISTGFAIYLLIQIAQAIGGIAQGILRR